MYNLEATNKLQDGGTHTAESNRGEYFDKTLGGSVY